MAYRLKFSNGTETVALASDITLASDFDVEFKVITPPGNQNTKMLVTSSFWTGTWNQGQKFLASWGGSVNASTQSYQLNTIQTVKIVRTSGSVDLIIDGSLDSTFTNTADLVLEGIGDANGNWQLEYLSIIDSGTLIHYYDPSATGGTGTVLEDTAGSNDGDLQSFNGTTNSWWVFYDDGGGVSIPVIMNHLQNQGIA
jgi:hypothetical protein